MISYVSQEYLELLLYRIDRALDNTVNTVKPLLECWQCSAVDSFSNPWVLAVIAKLQKVEIRLRTFSEPSNFWGALVPPALCPAIYTAAMTATVLRVATFTQSFHCVNSFTYRYMGFVFVPLGRTRQKKEFWNIL